MKRILSAILLGAIFLCATPAHSQQTMTLSDDTLAASATEYATLQVYQPVDLVTISFVLTKITGTPTGTVIPQASIDGTNYVDISTDTLTLANVASNVKIWTFLKAPYKYYRTKIVLTSATQSVIQSAKLFTRQPPK